MGSHELSNFKTVKDAKEPLWKLPGPLEEPGCAQELLKPDTGKSPKLLRRIFAAVFT